MGGYLAELSTGEEDVPLEDHLYQGLFYWIGLSDAASEGSWRWMESHQRANYTNWHPGEPQGGTSQACVFKSLSPYGWYDATCTATQWPGNGQLHALCETFITG